MRCSAAASASRRCSTRRSRSAPSSPASLLCHGLILFLLYRLVRRLHRQQGRQPALPFQLRLLRRRRRARGADRQISGAGLLQRRDELPDRPQSRRRQPGRRAALQPERSRPDRASALGGAAVFYAVALLVLRRKRWRDVPAAPGPLPAEPAASSPCCSPRRRSCCSRSTGSTTPAPRRSRFNGVLALSTLAARGDRFRPRRLELLLLPARPAAVRRQPPSLCARHARRRHRPGRLGGDFAFSGEGADDAAPPVIAGAQAQRHPDRARKHPRRRDRPPRRRPPAHAGAGRARRATAAAPAPPTAMSASPPSRCRACSPASSRRSTTASRWSAISSPTAIRSASSPARPRISATPRGSPACAAARSSSTARC